MGMWTITFDLSPIDIPASPSPQDWSAVFLGAAASAELPDTCPEERSAWSSIRRAGSRWPLKTLG